MLPELELASERLTTAAAHVVSPRTDASLPLQIGINDVFRIKAARGYIAEWHLLHAVLNAPRVALR
jgi:hypothetical protein